MLHLSISLWFTISLCRKAEINDFWSFFIFKKLDLDSKFWKILFDKIFRLDTDLGCLENRFTPSRRGFTNRKLMNRVFSWTEFLNVDIYLQIEHITGKYRSIYIPMALYKLWPIDYYIKVFVKSSIINFKAQTNNLNLQSNLKPSCKVCNGPALGIYFKGKLSIEIFNNISKLDL